MAPKTLSLELAHDSLDEKICHDLDALQNKEDDKQQDYLRMRLRTGYILHELLGDTMAETLHDLHTIDDESRWLVLDSAINHARLLIAHKKMTAPLAPATTPDTPATETPKKKRKNPFPMIGA